MKRKTIIAFAAGLLQIAAVFAQGNHSKTEQYTFKKTELLKIDNSFGDVTVRAYNGSEIQVQIDIVIETKGKSGAEKVQDKIKIRATESAGVVSLVTENKINGTSVRSFEINYTVDLPPGVALEIKNQFGDVVIGDLKENLNLNLQHGDCTINKASGKLNKIKMQFGDLRIESSPRAEINLQHGDLRGGTLSNLSLDHMFGDATIRQLSGKNTIETQHGDFEVEQLEAGLKQLELDVQFGNVTLGNITGNSYKISLDGSFTNFRWDDVINSNKGGITIISERDELNRNTAVLESAGSAAPLNTITINAQHSDVKLK